jgi:hypothetical protein
MLHHFSTIWDRRALQEAIKNALINEYKDVTSLTFLMERMQRKESAHEAVLL